MDDLDYIIFMYANDIGNSYLKHVEKWNSIEGLLYWSDGRNNCEEVVLYV